VQEAAKTERIWRFGVFQVDARSEEVRRGGTPVRMREQCFRILVYLVEHAGELVTREDLRRVLWPSDTFVDFEHSLNAAVMKLRDVLGDVADRPIYIETVPKRGYRFIAPVTSPIVSPGAKQPEAERLVRKPRGSSISGNGEMAATSNRISGLAATSNARSAEGFWIAVLPFKWSGTEPHLASCADGATEDIVTGLSRFSYLRVVAASSMAKIAGKSVDARAAIDELGARYLLEGSLRQAGPRIRLAAKLVDCETGAHLWAETYDRAFCDQDQFDLLDDVVPQIVSTIADIYGVLPRSMGEALRGKNPERLTPYEAVLRCFAYFQRLSAEEHLPAKLALERAVEQAPGYADAWAMLSLIYKEGFTQGFDLLPDSLDRAHAAARCAVEIAPSNHLAHHALAAAEFFRGEHQRFRLAASRALELNPMDGFTLAYLGFLIAYAGDWKRGGVLSASARRLNPHHPGWYWFVPGMEAYRSGDYRAALEFADRANMPDFWRTSLLAAAARGQLGQREAAGEALRALLEQRPDLREKAREGLNVWWQPEMVEKLLAGLEKAGLAVAVRD
jgi:TolB-like protein/DNA-binding winged helix-turn-helix (wHTH) protein